MSGQPVGGVDSRRWRAPRPSGKGTETVPTSVSQAFLVGSGLAQQESFCQRP